MAMDKELQPGERSNWSAAGLILAGGAVAVFAALKAILSLPGIPHNVREMFPAAYRVAAMAGFSLAAAWAGFAPGVAARIVLSRPRAFLAPPLGAAVAALAMWFALRFSITDKAIRDLVGSATLGIGREWEYIGRFVALGGGAMLLLMAGGIGVAAIMERGWRGGWRLAAGMFAVAVPFLAVARIVVINCASTDNLTELLRASPWPGDVFLMVLIALLGANAAALACARGMRVLWAVLATAVLILPGWWLLRLALEPEVHKYGMVFPAVQFLLGPDRQTALSTESLMSRWAVVQVGSAAILACGWKAAARAMGSRPAERDAAETPAADASGRGYGALTAAYAILLFGASLTPFNFDARPVGEAWRTFWNIEFLTRRDSGPADIAINLLAFIPFSFLAMAALTRQGTRGRGWPRAALVMAVGLLLSATMEFLQMFVHSSREAAGAAWMGGRTTSLFDIVSQTAGAIVGLILWFAWGRAITGRARAAIAEQRDRSLLFLATAVYMLGLTLYQTAPFDFSLSVSRVGHRFKPFWMGYPPAADEIRVITVPFTDSLEMPNLMGNGAWWGDWVLKAALLMPAGAMLACILRGRRHPIAAAFFLSAALAVGIEILQIFLLSRFPSATDCVLGAAGGLAGALLGSRLGRASRRAKAETPAGPA
jgi:glycopeptide antibiotics resistance protein